MNDGLRVRRIADLLARHAEHRIKRAHIVWATDTMHARVSTRVITRLWPEIENYLGELGLYAVRPIGVLDYGTLATSNPLIAVMPMWDREKNVVTRLRNDERGAIMQKIAEYHGRGSVEAALRLERIRVYLSAYDHQVQGMRDLYNLAVDEFNSIPWAELTDADMIPWETNGRR